MTEIFFCGHPHRIHRWHHNLLVLGCSWHLASIHESFSISPRDAPNMVLLKTSLEPRNIGLATLRHCTPHHLITPLIQDDQSYESYHVTSVCLNRCKHFEEFKYISKRTNRYKYLLYTLQTTNATSFVATYVSFNFVPAGCIQDAFQD